MRRWVWGGSLLPPQEAVNLPRVLLCESGRDHPLLLLRPADAEVQRVLVE